MGKVKNPYSIGNFYRIFSGSASNVQKPNIKNTPIKQIIKPQKSK